MGKKIKMGIITICATLCIFLSMSSIYGDVGNTFSGGDSSSGSSWSSGGGSSGGGLSSEISVYILIISIIVIIVYWIFSVVKSKDNMQDSKVNRNILSEAKVVESILNIDPEFTLETFKTQVSDTYLTLQDAWKKKNWELARTVESDALFHVHHRQIQEYIERGLTNHLEMQNILNVSLTAFKQDGNLDVISVKLIAELIDYTSEDATGKVINGSKTMRQKRAYHLEFVRFSGEKTNSKVKESETNCPNCGAPIESEDLTTCPYCQSVFIKQKVEWLINKYEEW